MDVHEATTMLQPVVRPGDSVWADIGAGNGTFTEALASPLGSNQRSGDNAGA